MTSPWHSSVFLILQPRSSTLSRPRGKRSPFHNIVPVNLSRRLFGSSHSIRALNKTEGQRVALIPIERYRLQWFICEQHEVALIYTHNCIPILMPCEVLGLFLLRSCENYSKLWTTICMMSLFSPHIATLLKCLLYPSSWWRSCCYHSRGVISINSSVLTLHGFSCPFWWR